MLINLLISQRKWNVANQPRIEKAVEGQKKKVYQTLKPYGNNLDENVGLDASDFEFHLKRSVGDRRNKDVDKFVDLSEGSQDAQRLFSESPVMGDGSFMTLNGKGIGKVMQRTSVRGNWQDLYMDAINTLSMQRGMRPDEVRQAM